MTRRVEDAAAILGAIAGHDDNDPTSLPGSAPDYLANLDAGVNGLRIGFDEAYCSEGVAAPVVRAIRRGLDILKARGAEIVPVSMPKWRDAVEQWATLCAIDLAEQPDGVTQIVTYTSPQDLTGNPAIILPGGLDDGGAPVGFQLVGRHLEEGKLFEAGIAYQADANWPNRPPLAV